MSDRFGRGLALLRRWPEWSAAAAAGWSLAYAAAGVLWSTGGPGFPFGVADPEAGDMGSLFVGLRAAELGPALAVTCLGAALAARAMRPGHIPRGRRTVLVVGWGMAGLLALVIPDVRLMRSFAYLMAGGVGFVATADWPVLNQLICVGGGVLWAAATLAFQRRTAPRRAAPPSRDVAAERERWRRRARHLATVAAVMTLPYELSRWAWALGWPVGVTSGAEVIERWSSAERIATFTVGALPFVGGLLAHGLAARWGEVVPRRVPWLGGRAVPAAFVVATAGTATLLIVTGALALHKMTLNAALDRVPPAHPDIAGWGAWAPGVFWLPWGLALGAATYCHWRRRRLPCRRAAGVRASVHR